MAPEDRIVFVNTFSKNWAMTGWRMGWIAAHPSLGQVVENLIQYSTSGVAQFMQRAGVVALEQGEDFVRATGRPRPQEPRYRLRHSRTHRAAAASRYRRARSICSSRSTAKPTRGAGASAGRRGAGRACARHRLRHGRREFPAPVLRARSEQIDDVCERIAQVLDKASRSRAPDAVHCHARRASRRAMAVHRRAGAIPRAIQARSRFCIASLRAALRPGTRLTTPPLSPPPARSGRRTSRPWPRDRAAAHSA